MRKDSLYELTPKKKENINENCGKNCELVIINGGGGGLIQ